MYCPKCGTQNVDDASFCRGCGANVSLVPQALAGHAPAPVVAGQTGQPTGYEREAPPNLSHAIVRIFIGIAFVFVALSVKNVHQIAGQIWWFWMLIPAFGALGRGAAELVRLHQRQQKQTGHLPPANAYVPPVISQAPHAAELPQPPQARAGADFYRPSSVTENTTKLLEKDR
jgi:hypothetical protein